MLGSALLASGLAAKFWVPSSGATISILVCDTVVVDSGHRVGDGIDTVFVGYSIYGDGVGDDVVIEECKLDC